jgi:nitrite reductase/ring-hydroxylating ferredoxin subunit
VNDSYRPLCSSDELKDNSFRVFTVDAIDVLVGRRNGRLFACNNSCPHRGASLSKGEFSGDNIICYMHGYEFNVFTGRLENMKSWKKEETWMEQSPEWRKSGDLVLYQIKEYDGTVYVRL